MKRTPILVCSDAGAAGRVLLARRDIELRWALTRREAEAVLESGFPRLCLVRENLALAVLQKIATLPADRRPPCLVLLDEGSWSRREIYFGRGATALMRESNGERILEAISELTGVQFSVCPRVPHVTVLDVSTEEGRFFADSLDLSASGISVRDLPNVRVGLTAEITFAMYEPTITVHAMVVRTFVEEGETIAGLTFVGMDERTRARIASIVEAERKAMPRLPEPVGLSIDLVGSFTLDIGEALDQDVNASAIYRAMLRECVEHPEASAPLPGWLQRVATAMTSIERDALVGRDAPEWASAVIDLRIRLRRQRTDVADEMALDLDIERVLELCRGLAVESEKVEDSVACSVAEIRAGFLREVYGDPSKMRIGADTTVALKPLKIQRLSAR